MKRMIVTALLLLPVLCGCPAGAGRRGGGAGVNTGARDFAARDINGKRLRLSDYRDKVVILVFWSSWCTACFGKLRYLDGLYSANKDAGLVVIAASMDQPQTRAQVKPTVKRYKFQFRVFIDENSRAIRRYNPRRTETFTLLISKGRVVGRWAPLNTADLPALKKAAEDQLKKRAQRPGA